MVIPSVVNVPTKSAAIVFKASGGTRPYQWSWTGGDALADGATLTYAPGIVPGSFMVSALDARGVSFAVPVKLTKDVFAIQPSAVGLAPGENQVFRVTGGVPPYTWYTLGGTIMIGTGETFDYTAGSIYGEYTISVMDSSGGNLFPIDQNPSGAASISAAFDGTNYLVATWGDAVNHNRIGAQLISPNGAVLGPHIAVGRSGSEPPFVAFDGVNYLLVWDDDAAGPNGALYGQFVSPAGNLVGSPFPITPPMNGMFRSGLAFGQGKYLAVYEYQVSGSARVFGRLIDPAGTVGPELPISSGVGYQSGLQNVAFDGTNFFAVWRDYINHQQKGRWVSPAGGLLQEIIVNASAGPADNPQLAFDGTNYLALWSDQVSGEASEVGHVYGQFVSPAGPLIGGRFVIFAAPGHQMAPLAHFSGSQYLVTWQNGSHDLDGDGQCESGEATCYDVSGQFVSPAGTLNGSEFPITKANNNQLGGVVGYTAGKFLVMVNYPNTLDFDSELNFGNLYGALVREDNGPDTDGDGMFNWWENQFDCVNPGLADATKDPDRDGYDNLDEFQNLSDPCESWVASAKLTITEDVGRAIIVAGGGLLDDNRLVNNINYLGNFAYRTLIARGFTPDKIFYLNPEPDPALRRQRRRLL